MKTILLFLMMLGAVCLALAQAPAANSAKKSTTKSVQTKLVLPERLVSAKTMCIQPMLSAAPDVAEARTELKAWGHFTVVEDCSQADVGLWINARHVPDIKLCRTMVQVIGNAEKKVLWSEAADCKTSTKGTVGLLVRKLHKDMASAAPQKKSKS